MIKEIILSVLLLILLFINFIVFICQLLDFGCCSKTIYDKIFNDCFYDIRNATLGNLLLILLLIPNFVIYGLGFILRIKPFSKRKDKF